MVDCGIPSVAELAADVAGVVRRFRDESTFAFSFGDGRYEAVVLTFDEFEDLDGEGRIPYASGELSVEEVASGLPAMIAAVRAGGFVPVVWGDGAEPRLMIMSADQYRDLRGDDHPPQGVDVDPCRRVYASEPLPTSRPFDLAEWDREHPLPPEAIEAVRRKYGKLPGE